MSASSFKHPFIVLALPLVMWASIRSYWSDLYYSGVVEYYNAGAMVVMRGAVLFPIQLLVLGAMAFRWRRRLRRVPWVVLIIACAVGWPLAVWIDRLGMDHASARWLWDVGPPVASAVLLGLALSVVGSAPNSTQQPTSDPSDARGSASKTLDEAAPQ